MTHAQFGHSFSHADIKYSGHFSGAKQIKFMHIYMHKAVKAAPPKPGNARLDTAQWYVSYVFSQEDFLVVTYFWRYLMLFVALSDFGACQSMGVLVRRF